MTIQPSAMGNKLSFYDFAGYIIPGAFVAAMICWLLKELNVPLNNIDLGSLEKSVLFIIISYMAGHFIAAIAGRWARTKGIPFVNFSFSEDMLRPVNSKYDRMYRTNPTEEFTDDFKQKLHIAFKKTWKIDFNNSEKDLQSCFDITYAFVCGKNLNPKVDVFNGLYGLSKNLLVALRLAVYISLLSALLIVLLYATDKDNDWWIYPLERAALIKLAMPLIAAIVFILLTRPLLRLQETYGLRLVKAVYHSFWAWYCTKNPD
jgi:hypothetical protein